jgi:hypothetical protein
VGAPANVIVVGPGGHQGLHLGYEVAPSTHRAPLEPVRWPTSWGGHRQRQASQEAEAVKGGVRLNKDSRLQGGSTAWIFPGGTTLIASGSDAEHVPGIRGYVLIVAKTRASSNTTKYLPGTRVYPLVGPVMSLSWLRCIIVLIYVAAGLA